MIHISGEREGDFIVRLKMVDNLKLTNCLFLEFSTRYFQTAIDHGQLKLQKMKLRIKGWGGGGVSIVYETLGIRQKTMTPERQKRKRWEPYHCLRLLQKAHSQAVSQGMEWQVASVVSFHRIDGTEDLKRSGILNAWDREQEKRKLRRARTPELWSKYLLSIQQDSNGQIHVKKRPRFKKNGRNSTHTPTKLRRGIPTKQTREPHNSQSAG